MLFRTGSGERNDTGLIEIPEEDLRFGFLMILSYCSNGMARQNVRVCGESPKTLIGDFIISAPVT